MPTETYRITTDKGVYDVTVETGASTPLPAAATAGMARQSTAAGDPASFMGRTVPPEIEAMNEQEMMGTSPFVPNPIPLAMRGLSAVGRAAIPYASRAAQVAANNPRTVAAAVGAAPGVVAGNPQAAVTGAILGAMGGGKAKGRPSPRTRPTAATVASEAEAAAPVAATPPPPTPAAAPSAAPRPPAPTAGPGSWSPARIRNEVGLAARRAKVTLSEKELAEADHLVTQGATPRDAVQTVASGAPAPAPPASAPTKAKLTAAETREWLRLRNMGKSSQEASAAIQAQREFVATFGTPTDPEMNAMRDNRKVPARWPAGTNR